MGQRRKRDRKLLLRAAVDRRANLDDIFHRRSTIYDEERFHKAGAVADAGGAGVSQPDAAKTNGAVPCRTGATGGPACRWPARPSSSGPRPRPDPSPREP
jgi:hypothetical protein